MSFPLVPALGLGGNAGLVKAERDALADAGRFNVLANVFVVALTFAVPCRRLGRALLLEADPMPSLGLGQNASQRTYWTRDCLLTD